VTRGGRLCGTHFQPPTPVPRTANRPTALLDRSHGRPAHQPAGRRAVVGDPQVFARDFRQRGCVGDRKLKVLGKALKTGAALGLSWPCGNPVEPAVGRPDEAEVVEDRPAPAGGGEVDLPNAPKQPVARRRNLLPPRPTGIARQEEMLRVAIHRHPSAGCRGAEELVAEEDLRRHRVRLPARPAVATRVDDGAYAPVLKFFCRDHERAERRGDVRRAEPAAVDARSTERCRSPAVSTIRCAKQPEVSRP
jgi:hypothetical protein